jgi:phosphatidylglycerophosphate synthase
VLELSQEKPPSIERLRVICQKEKLRAPDDLTRKHRTVSIYATWLLLHTKITADEVTVASIILGLLGALCLAAVGLGWGIVGVGLLYLSFLLDQVDGEVARYRGKGTLRGVYLDELRHLVIYPVPVFALAFDVARGVGDTWPFAVGFIAALGLVLARVESRLPALLAAEKNAMARAAEPGRPEPAAPAAPEDPARAIERQEWEAAARRVAGASIWTYDHLAHQVLILLWLLLAVVADRGFELGGVFQGLFLVLLAMSTTIALLAAIVAHARPGEVDREVRARAHLIAGGAA